MRHRSITDTIFGNENQTCVFTYDEFSRVTKDNCGSAWGAAYAYDLFGNMAKSTIAGSPGTSFQPTRTRGTAAFKRPKLTRDDVSSRPERKRRFFPFKRLLQSSGARRSLTD
jgi:hypothetical protein